MSQKRYDVNGSIRVFVQFFNLLGAKASPTTVKAAIKTPAGVTTQVSAPNIHPDVSNDPETGLPYVGRYYTDLVPLEGSDEEPYWVRFEGTGTVVAAEEQDVWVRPPQVVIV
jgi:hypothetical protein